MKKVIIVHGKRPLRSGKMHKAFKERLDKAWFLSKHNKFDCVIITGGKTRKGAKTEAELGLDYLRDKVNIPIYTENRSRTTPENVRRLKELLSRSQVAEITAITSERHLLRTKYLYSRLWQEQYSRIKFVGVRDSYPLFYCLVEFFYLIFAIFDPEEKTVATLTKKIFRTYPQ